MSQRSTKWLRRLSIGLMLTLFAAPTVASVSANQSSIAPRFTYAEVNPKQIDPASSDNNSAIIRFSVDYDANIKLEIRNATTNKAIRTLYGDIYGGNNLQPPLAAQAGTYYNIKWDGKDDYNSNVPASGNPSPTYVYYLEASNKYTNATTDVRTGALTVVYGTNPNQNQLVISQLSANPPQITPNQATVIRYHLNKAVSNVNVLFTNGNTTARVDGGRSMDMNTAIWDGTSYGAIVPAGYYTYTVYATDFNGNVVTAQGPQQVQVISNGGTCTAPHLSNLTSTIDQYNNQSIKLNFSIDRAAFVTIKVYDQYNNLKRTLYGETNPYQVTTAGNYIVTWDGKEDNGSSLSNGQYRYQIVATNYSGSIVCGSDSQSTYITIGNITDNSTPVISGVYATPTQIRPYNNEKSTIHYDLSNRVDTVTVKIMKGGSTVRTLTGTTYATNNNIPWDGKYYDGSMLEGSYDYVITATNNYNGKSVSYNSPTPISVLVSGGTNYGMPNITSVSVSPTSFNPRNYGSAQINYSIDKNAQVTVEVLDNNSNYQYTNNVLRTLLDTVDQSAGSHLITWNGLDRFGNTVTEGTYTIRIKAYNSYGTDTENTSVTVTSGGYYGGGTTPTITDFTISPTSFNPDNNGTTQIRYYTNQSAQIAVEVLNNGYYSTYACNSNSNILRTLVNNVTQSSGDHYITWDGKDSCGNKLPNGTYSIRITASNSSGTDTETKSVTINRSGGTNTNGNLIQNLSINPTVFNPERGEKTIINYNLARNATVTVQILNSNGNVIRTLVDHVSRYGNQNNYNYTLYSFADTWNGRDTNGNAYDGVYQVKITAYAADNETDTETAKVEVNLDGRIIGGGISGTLCAGYSDVQSNNRYCKAIELMKEKGIFNGYSDGTFRPYQQINRAEATKVILLAHNISINQDNYSTFSDTDNSSWYAPYVYTAKRLGIIMGYPDNTFRPDQTIKRVELLKIFLESSGLNILNCNSSAPYSDTFLTSETRWYMNYVCFSKQNNLMSDDGRGRFNPSTPMTRGDVADLFYQFDRSGLSSQTNPPRLYNTYTWEN